MKGSKHYHLLTSFIIESSWFGQRKFRFKNQNPKIKTLLKQVINAKDP
jgi:hypothetical protein